MSPKNPFYVLELDAAASPGEIERQSRKVLGLLELGAAKGASYTCALGTFPRDATMVREAAASLRDPKTRAIQSCLAKLLTSSDDARRAVAGKTHDALLDAPLRDAHLVAGYRGL